jgi:hypothetical protein
LGIVVSVRINESRSYDQSVGIDGLGRTIIDPADFCDHAVFNGDISQTPRRAGSVHYSSMFDQ